MSRTVRTRAGWLASLVLAIGGCMPTGGAGPEAGPTHPEPSATEPRTAGQARTIIIDTDLDHSDLAAILVLLRDPSVDVRAITIAGTGLVHCAGGRAVLRYVLGEMSASDVPVGCGRENGGPDARSFPEDWRALADAGYGLDIEPPVEPGPPPDAVATLTSAITAALTPALLVALGPLTNLEDAVAADPSLVGRIAGIHAMLGTIDEPGNVYVDGHDGDRLEWNAFADPSSVAAVLATDIAVELIPLDATADVPVPTDLADRLAGDRTGAGADLLYELLVRHPDRMRPDQGQQFWDELTALTVGDATLVTWHDANLEVGGGGRLTRDSAGRPVRFASAADRAAVEAALLSALRRGDPRAHPFTP
jgi:inosine-uridine nucleoside N-ribohydrolase